MAIEFARGTEEQPRGHALLYFQDSPTSDQVWVTYVVILPIGVDVSKYVPPFLMNQVGEVSPNQLSAFAFPPAPELQGSQEELQELASKRDDDILFGGTIDPSDVPAAMASINEAVQGYAELYARMAPEVGQADQPDDQEDSGGLGVSEVLYQLMSDGDRLGELTKLVGRLRFAVEGSDPALVEEAEKDIQLLARHLPDNHNTARLVEVVKASDSRSAQLADLYLQRCFQLVREEYTMLMETEAKIRELEEQQPTEQQ